MSAAIIPSAENRLQFIMLHLPKWLSEYHYYLCGDVAVNLAPTKISPLSWIGGKLTRIRVKTVVRSHAQSFRALQAPAPIAAMPRGAIGCWTNLSLD